MDLRQKLSFMFIEGHWLIHSYELSRDIVPMHALVLF
jgi:hypothetical protein